MKKTMKKIMVLLIGMTMLASMAAASDPLGLNLPPNPVKLRVTSLASDAYINVELSTVPGGYDVSNGNYKGWCADPDTTIYLGKYYSTTLYSSYDTNLPGYAQDNDWDKINYMVNEFRDGSYSCATRNEIQTLVWEYLDYPGEKLGSPDPTCMSIIRADVNANGNGFMPGSGDIVGVVCDNGVKVQLLFIEIFYFPAPELMGALLVMALVSPAFIYLVIKKRRD